MTWYSELPARRARQILGDAWLVAWSALWIWVAFRLHDLIMNLAAPGLAVADGATDLADRFTSAGEALPSALSRARIPASSASTRLIWMPVAFVKSLYSASSVG